MLTLSTRQQIAVGIVLAVLMAIMRGYHFPTLDTAPSASWAIFFLAGAYLGSPWILAGLMGTAGIVDYVAINFYGVSDFCVSPAYVALIPAYGALWLAGRWYAKRYAFKATTLFALAGSVFVGAFACELLSSGSFYYFSGRFAEPTLAEFATRFATYFPASLESMVFWVAIAGVSHAAVVIARSNTANTTQA